MKVLVLLAGAAIVAIASPAIAKPGNGHGNGNPHGNSEHMEGGHGHGNPHGNSGHAEDVHGNSRHVEAAHGNSAHVHRGHGNAHGVVVYGNDRLYALDRHGGCPPGLAKKGNGCLPPGQARKLYHVGQHYDRNFGVVWTYDQIPDYLRYEHRFDPGARYYYRDGYLYQVDPRTMLIVAAVSALLH